MTFYTIEFTVTERAVTPDTPQFAGHTGDHRAAVLKFAVPFEGCRYRLEIVDGCGGYDTTALLDAADGVVSYEIPSAWTAAGVAAVRLVAVEQDETGEEIVRFHSAPAYLTFADRADGEPLGDTARPAWQEALDEARFFLDGLGQKLQNGELNGEKGDKGDDGYTPQKGVDYYTDAEKAELIAELGARDVDQEFNADSSKAIANKCVTQLYDDFNATASSFNEQINANTTRLDEQEQMVIANTSCISAVDERLVSAEGQLNDVGAVLGTIDTALDGILAIQEALIGGGAE